MRVLQEGDGGRAICSRCEQRVRIRYEYGTFHLDETGVDVEDVLLGICEGCGGTVTIPAQSTPRLKAARQRKDELLDARVPRPLEDLLYAVAEEVGSSAPDFRSHLVRYYLLEIARNEATARRVHRLAQSPLAQGKKDARISVRVEAETLARAMEKAREEGLETRADVVRGLILAGAEDVLEGRAGRRRRELERIAAVA